MRTALLLSAMTLAGCSAARSSLDTVEQFRTAMDSGDHALAGSFLSDDPRVWYESREGDGSSWTLGGGRWKAWDDHFNSRSEVGSWHIEGSSVWAICREWNDYFALIERQGSPSYRLTYFLDDAGLIEGYMISSTRGEGDEAVDRHDDFKAWALEHAPAEWEYLRPGGRIDPTGDRALRTRELANRWRPTVGLPPIED